MYKVNFDSNFLISTDFLKELRKIGFSKTFNIFFCFQGITVNCIRW